jgi:glucose-6-phosphate isomerase
VQIDRFVLAPDLQPEIEPVLEQLARDDFLGQLLKREGKAGELGSEGGDPKLDWVDGVEKALAHPEWLAQCERDAQDVLQLGIRHVIWSGMGGSVQTVYVLKRLGFLDTPELHVYPCDSTDPASLNRILREIASHEEGPAKIEQAAFLRQLLKRTMMIGVSMGMTSEEPITHLEWFDGLLQQHQVPDRQKHIQVMTLPDSYLDRFARPRGCKMVPIQLDGGNHTPGRMSAPATRVFIVPVALRLAVETGGATRLQDLLQRLQALYGVSYSMKEKELGQSVRENPFIRLGALVAERARAGKDQVALVTSPEWNGFEPWFEQLIEESLGKGGKGFCLFYGDQDWRRLSTDPLILGLGTNDSRRTGGALELKLPRAVTTEDRLAVLGGLFAGFKLTVATFGYLHDIVFAGQPAVESYKAYARKYRDAEADVPFTADPADVSRFRSLTLFVNSLTQTGLMPRSDGNRDASAVLASVLRARRDGQGSLGYLDLTFNGDVTDELREALEFARKRIANGTLGIPCKIRTGPSDYHSTEQGEVDGPDSLVSIRLVALKHESPLAGRYSDKFLLAQARGTWQAMEDARRWVLMITFPELNRQAIAELRELFEKAASQLR